MKKALMLAVPVCLAAAALAQVNILGYWWENPLPYQRTPKGLKSISAAECGVCHAEIYREWKSSAHAQALSDLQFQAELTKSPETKWLCLNCHTPLLNQLSSVAVSVRDGSTHQPVLKDNSRYNSKLGSEGVTCAVCHVRDGVIIGPYGDSRAPHPVKRDARLLSTDLCAMCHQATASYTDTLVCSFDTAEEWKASPYAAGGQQCSHCHMPAVQRAVAAGGPRRSSRRHYFAGSMIPKTVQGEAAGAAANPGNLYRSGLTVEVVKAAVSGRHMEVHLRLKNAHAGHKLPTGDPERFIRVDAALLVREKAAGTKSVRIGQHWEWWPKARKLSDNRLLPLEERVEKLYFPAPPAGPRAVEITVTNVRMNRGAAEYHKLVGKYPLEAVVQRFRRPLP